MPVFVWGNGACSDDGTSAQNFLAQIASYGFVAISSGAPGGNGGSTTAEWMNEAVEWVVGGANGLNVDSSRIMAAGFSCGGTEAYQMQDSDAVSSIGIFSSGLLGDYEFASKITKPTMYALGGPNDIAYGNVSLLAPALPPNDSIHACPHILIAINRASATTPHFPRPSLPGRATSTVSATAVHTASPTAASSPKLLPTGCCGFTRAMLRLARTSPTALATLLDGTMLRAATSKASLFPSVAAELLLPPAMPMRLVPRSRRSATATFSM